MNPKHINILIGCECSGAIRSRFRDAGFNAFSCDLKPSEDNSPYHFQEDVREAVVAMQWDLILLHPDCTSMAVSGNRFYARGTPGYAKRLGSIDWTLGLWQLAKDNSHRVALENPVSVIFSRLKSVGVEVFYLQPWQHGHGECKATGFALHNLPAITPTNIVEGREQRVWKMGPSDTRKADRSRTYPGIAQAIVDQWGAVLLGD